MESTDNNNQRGESDTNRRDVGEAPDFSYYLRLGVAEHETSFFDVWNTLRNEKLRLFTVVLIFVFLATLAVILLPTQYLAEVVVADAQPKTQSTNGQSSPDATPDLTASISIEEALAMVESRVFVNDFIQASGILPILFANKWNDATKTWKKPGTVTKYLAKIGLAITVPTMWDAYNKFTSSVLDVSTDEDTQLHTISVKWTDPVVAAEWANALVKGINSKLRERAIRESSLTIEYLNKELATTSAVELQQALYELMETQMARIVSAQVHEEYAFRVVDPAIPPQNQAIPYFQGIVIGIGIVLGLFFAISYVLFRSASSKWRNKDPRAIN